jgi:polyadenylate-binding protein
MMGMPGMPGQIPSMAQGGMRGGAGGQSGRGSAPNARGQLNSFSGGRGAGNGPAAPGIDMNLLSSAPPNQQKQMLGEALYPKIHEQQPELAGKITGMLLEMDNSELVNLISDDNALRAKVQEALTVYDEYIKSKGGEGSEDGPKAPTNGIDADKAE